jgi:hypothetical protein
MKLTFIPLLFLAALLFSASVSAQNLGNSNDPVNLDNNFQVAVNTNPVNQSDAQQINMMINVSQVQTQAPVQQAANTNRGNPSGNDYNQVKQVRYGQSIAPVSGGGGGGSYSAKAHKHSHKGSSAKYLIQKIFKEKYNAPRHYSHKSRVKKCHSF